MRTRQKHVITVVLDTTFDITFHRLDARHGSSVSRSTDVEEIESPGTSNEKRLGPRDSHGFLWRLNTYWSYEERDGGLYMQIESVSLSRAIPEGLGWAIKPFVESVPREYWSSPCGPRAMLCGRSRTTQNHSGEQAADEVSMSTNADSVGDGVSFSNARRVNRSLTAAAEKRALEWMARRAPKWVTSDQLTIMGLAAQISAGVCYALARQHRYFLLLVCVCMAMNWLGDSLDGTLARVRRQQRPRYGFYVDHMVDIIGATALMCGLGFSGFLHWQTAVAMLIAFLVLSGESYLATYTLNCFELSHGFFGPTEIRSC